ncbi:MAG: PaaI family thioesterase [Anaerolineae bacterium]|nr:PaaI family thioesterase [Anaerolineae bacterium]
MSDSSQPDKLNAQQPSARWCFVCGVENPFGLKIRFFNDGRHQAVAYVTLGDEFQGYPGVAHGGILVTILDETMGRAILADGETSHEIADERFMFTAKMEVRYRQPVPLHQEFTVRGRIDTDRRRTAQASGEIVLADGTVAVEASATLVDIPAEHIEHMLTEDIGWQVYP